MAKKIEDPWLRDVAKDQTVFLGPIRRWVESQTSEVDPLREVHLRHRGIHPSELAREDFCRRASFYEVAGIEPEGVLVPIAHRIQLIYEEGTQIHEKWQGWAWDMGALIGLFGCLICRERGGDWTWWDQAPKICGFCGAGRIFLRYLEVPIYDPETLIVGHADIRVGRRLGEIKSVGPRSIEIENPRLWERFTHKLEIEGEERTLYDLAGMWRSLKRPFPSHIKQLQLYLHVTGLDEGFVLYEWKVNQGPKEFPIPYHPPMIEPLLEMCADIKYALDKGKPPRCNQDPFNGCSRCHLYEEAA